MITVIVVGDDKFYADVDKARVETPFLIMHSLDEIGSHVKVLAESLAPIGETGVLKTYGIGQEEAKPTIGYAEGYTSDWLSGTESIVPEGDKTYQGVVGLRKEVRYSLFVHEGTGLWGPNRSIIYASKGNVFRLEKEGRVFYRKWFRGQRPQPFLKEAIEAASVSFIPLRVKYLGEQLVHPGIG